MCGKICKCQVWEIDMKTIDNMHKELSGLKLKLGYNLTDKIDSLQDKYLGKVQ